MKRSSTILRPFHLFSDVFDQIARTLKALVTGYVSPKGMAGPVGIVQIIQHGWSLGVKEALYWMGLISLNLAMLNLLPPPGPRRRADPLCRH